MIKGKTFICLGNNMWESNFTNTVSEIMNVLSSENTILYVDYAFTFKDIVEALKGNKRELPLKKILGWEPRLRTVRTRVNSSIFVLSPPPVLPINRIPDHGLFKKLLSLNAFIVERQLKKAIQKTNIKDPIVVSAFNPYYGSMLTGKLNEILNIYYCYDEIGIGWHSHHGPKIEDHYITKTDLVITTSDHLFQQKSCKTLNCELIKNGVDFSAFNHFFKKSESKDKKVIGYTGSIDDRFDIETVLYLISNLPDVEFLFAGRIPDEKVYKLLSPYKNTRWLGAKKPEEVPAIIAGIDLGIVPYIKSDFTKGVYPLKFNEYLAAGKPVVSSDFAVLPEFQKVIRFASSKEEFLGLVKEELEQDNEIKREQRTRFAFENSWEKRAEEFSLAVSNALERKKIN